MGMSAPVREDAPVSVTSPAKLTAWAVEDAVSSPILLTSDQIATVESHYARLRKTYASRPERAHHTHEPLNELNPF